MAHHPRVSTLTDVGSRQPTEVAEAQRGSRSSTSNGTSRRCDVGTRSVSVLFVILSFLASFAAFGGRGSLLLRVSKRMASSSFFERSTSFASASYLILVRLVGWSGPPEASAVNMVSDRFRVGEASRWRQASACLSFSLGPLCVRGLTAIGSGVDCLSCSAGLAGFGSARETYLRTGRGHGGALCRPWNGLTSTCVVYDWEQISTSMLCACERLV